MSDNVVSLFGQPARSPAEEPAPLPAHKPVEGLVQELERLLDAAKAGEIIGFAGAFQSRSRVVGYAFAGAVQGYAMLGGLECVRMRLAERAIEADRI